MKKTLIKEAMGVADVVFPAINKIMPELINILKDAKQVNRFTVSNLYNVGTMSRFPLNDLDITISFKKVDGEFSNGSFDMTGHTPGNVTINKNKTFNTSLNIDVSYNSQLKFNGEFKTELEDTLLHELTHMYEFYNNNKSTSAHVMNAVKRDMGDSIEGSRSLDVFMQLINFSLKPEQNAYISAFYNDIKNVEDVIKRKQILRDNKLNVVIAGLKGFKGSTMYAALKRDIAKGVKNQELVEAKIESFITDFYESMKKYNKEFIGNENGIKKIDLYLKRHVEKPIEFFNVFEKLFNRIGEKYERKLLKMIGSYKVKPHKLTV